MIVQLLNLYLKNEIENKCGIIFFADDIHFYMPQPGRLKIENISSDVSDPLQSLQLHFTGRISVNFPRDTFLVHKYELKKKINKINVPPPSHCFSIGFREFLFPVSISWKKTPAWIQHPPVCWWNAALYPRTQTASTNRVNTGETQHSVLVVF